MKKTKSIEFNLDVEEFVKEYGITKDFTKEEILFCIDDTLCGCDDEIYYNYSAKEVYDEYKEEIDKCRANKEISLLQVFDEMLKELNFDSVKKKNWIQAIPLIRKKLKQ